MDEWNVYAVVTGVVVRGDGELETDDPSRFFIAVSNGRIALTA
jgi:hypothetical protein